MRKASSPVELTHRLLLLAVATIFAVGLLGASVFALDGAERGDAPDGHTSQWQWLHGREYVTDPTGCNECHVPLDCRTCHLAEYPHPAQWPDVHGATAVKTDFLGCDLCHRSAYCDPCHGGVEMPHPDDFARTHTSEAGGARSCALCHEERDCAACHERHGSHRLGGVVFQ